MQVFDFKIFNLTFEVQPCFERKPRDSSWAEYAEQQREMLQAWSNYIEGLAPPANLVV